VEIEINSMLLGAESMSPVIPNAEGPKHYACCCCYCRRRHV